MSNLESIVPPVELCKQIPEGEFVDSALVWVYDDVVEFLCRTSGCEQIHKKEWQIEHNHPRKIAIRRESGHEIYPAPTQEEILDDFFFNGAVFCKGGIRIGNDFYEYPTESEEALRLWFEIKGIEVK